LAFFGQVVLGPWGAIVEHVSIHDARTFEYFQDVGVGLSAHDEALLVHLVVPGSPHPLQVEHDVDDAFPEEEATVAGQGSLVGRGATSFNRGIHLLSYNVRIDSHGCGG
jgi:hypothetical protein